MVTTLLFAAGAVLLFLALLSVLGIFVVGTASWAGFLVAGVICLIVAYILANGPRGRI